MRIAAALIVTMIVGAALRPDHAQPRGVHHRRRRRPCQRRAGLCRILRRRRDPRREPRRRNQAAYRARREGRRRCCAALAKHNVSVERSSFRAGAESARRAAGGQEAGRIRISRDHDIRAQGQPARRRSTSVDLIDRRRRPVRGANHPLRHQGRGARHRRRAPRGGEECARQAEVYADAAGVKLGDDFGNLSTASRRTESEDGAARGNAQRAARRRLGSAIAVRRDQHHMADRRP